MEYNISDLLDDLPEVPVDIQPRLSASEERIKELTMKKIHTQGKYQAKPRGIGFARKLLIAAVLITALAVPVMAAGIGWLTDWLAVTEERKESLQFHIEEADALGSKNWDISGWFIEMWSEEVTSTGMTLVCNEFSNEPHEDHLYTNEHYWIEKWSGTGYEKMEATVPEGEAFEVQQKTTSRWTVDWSDTYGSLESGYYRIAKTFTCKGDGGEESTVFYGTFRVFTEEMEPYIRKCNDTLAEVIVSDSWHMTWTNYPYWISKESPSLQRSVMEIWKSGEDYLFMDTVYTLDGSVRRCYGYMLRDGKGYMDLTWAGDTVDSELLDWQVGDFVDQGNFELWPSGMNIWDNLVGQVCDNGNQIIAIEFNKSLLPDEPIEGEPVMTEEEVLKNWPFAYHAYTERTFTFDDKGELIKVHSTVQTAPDVPDSEKVLYQVLEIHDTSADEIAAVIAKQDLSKVDTFSFGEDYALYQDMGKTEGFVNTDQISMDSVDEVIDRARQETDPKKDPDYRDGRTYNCAEAYYDGNTGMWKVEFWFSQDSEFKNFQQIVYLDTNGITKLIVYP